MLWICIIGICFIVIIVTICVCTRNTQREGMTYNPSSLLKRKSLSAIKKNPATANDNLSGVKTYYINLDRAHKRNELMTSEANNLGISLTRLDAADGKKLKNSKNCGAKVTLQAKLQRS